MPLDPHLLAAVREAALALQQAEANQEGLRTRHRSRLRELAAAGATLREIAAALGLSHQRVHQLVKKEGDGGAREAVKSAPVSASCGLCGEGAVPAGAARALCRRCAAEAAALLGGRALLPPSPLRLMRRHQRARCGWCHRLPAAGETLVAGPAGAICRDCLDGRPSAQ